MACACVRLRRPRHLGRLGRLVIIPLCLGWLRRPGGLRLAISVPDRAARAPRWLVITRLPPRWLVIFPLPPRWLVITRLRRVRRLQLSSLQRRVRRLQLSSLERRVRLRKLSSLQRRVRLRKLSSLQRRVRLRKLSSLQRRVRRRKLSSLERRVRPPPGKALLLPGHSLLHLVRLRVG